MIRSMNLRNHANRTLSEVEGSAQKVASAAQRTIETTEWATVALVSVAALSLIGLFIGCIALQRSTHAH
jgi:uncharacterized transporter YbjL